MTQFLKLAEFSYADRMTQLYIGSGRVKALFDSEGLILFNGLS